MRLHSVGWLNIGSIVASTCTGKLEGLDGEGEVLVIGVVDKEPVIDVLLEALGLIASWDKGASLTLGGTLLNPGSLGESLVVGFDSINHYSPLSISVDSSERLDVGSFGGTEVSLLHNLLQPGHRVLCVGQNILVDGLNAFVVILQSMLNLVGRVLSILQTPGLRVTNGALGWLVMSVLRLRVSVGRLRVTVGRGGMGVGRGGMGVSRGRMAIGRGMGNSVVSNTVMSSTVVSNTVMSNTVVSNSSVCNTVVSNTTVVLDYRLVVSSSMVSNTVG